MNTKTIERIMSKSYYIDIKYIHIIVKKYKENMKN